MLINLIQPMQQKRIVIFACIVAAWRHFVVFNIVLIECCVVMKAAYGDDILDFDVVAEQVACKINAFFVYVVCQRCAGQSFEIPAKLRL